MERQPDLHLHIVIPNEFQPLGKKNIGFTAGIEHTIPPGDWVEGVNRMDMPIFTSEVSKKSFEDIYLSETKKNSGIIDIQKKIYDMSEQNEI